MSDPQEAATPSDPHSAEARAKYPDDYNGWSPQGIVIPSLREGFDAGRVSRDAEVAELKAKIAELHPEDVEWDHASWGYKEACIGCPTCHTDGACPTRQTVLGSASSPVEGGN